MINKMYVSYTAGEDAYGMSLKTFQNIISWFGKIGKNLRILFGFGFINVGQWDIEQN